MAEEKTFSVGVQTSSPKRISVTSNVSENPITASADTGLYYSQLAKNWAIGEGLIQNEDYSSKTWAGESKSSADLSKMYSEAASLDLNNLENKIIEYDEQLNTTITEGLENINTSVTEGVETIETLQANSLAEITTNKESALSDIDINKTNTLAQISTLANTSISDINAVGKSYDNLTYRNITNCLLEVPQRIKYDLTDGTLTVKAGTVVIVPYGTEDKTSELPVGATFLNDNFKVYDTQYTEDADGNGKFFVWAEVQQDVISQSGSTTGTTVRSLSLQYNADNPDGGVYVSCLSTNLSGVDGYTGTGNCAYYNTSTNKLLRYSSGVLESNTTRTFPLMIVQANGGYEIGLINQVFNGMGYIGSTVWVNKGVKFLIPDGRNEDGSLKNIETTLTKVCVVTNNIAFLSGKLVLTPTSISSGGAYCVDANGYTYSEDEPTTTRWYKPSANMFYLKRDGVWLEDKQVHIGSFSKTTTSFTSFEPKQPFRAADDQDVVKKSGDTMNGNLTISKSGTSDLDLKNTTIDYTSTEIPTSATRVGGVFAKDKNGKVTGSLQSYIDTSGNYVTNLYAKRLIDGAEKSCSISAYISNTGSIWTYAPTPAAGDNSTKIATTAFVKSVLSSSGNGLATFKKAANGYVKFNNGIIIQWGRTSLNSHANGTVTFPVAFTSTNYKVVASSYTTGDYGENCGTASYSTTSFKLYNNIGTTIAYDWIAVGY